MEIGADRLNKKDFQVLKMIEETPGLTESDINRGGKKRYSETLLKLRLYDLVKETCESNFTPDVYHVTEKGKQKLEELERIYNRYGLF